MKYIDSNVFIYASLHDGDEGEWCRDLLEVIEKGEDKGGSSYLTYDEMFWKIENATSKKEAVEATEVILTMPNLRFFEVDNEVIWNAHQLISKRGLDPRDAIHASTAIVHGVYTIVSEDDDFDDLEDIDREWLDD